jgi:hypothetical protein
MLKKILIFILTIAYFTFNYYNNTFSYYSKEEVRVYYNKFYEKVENKYEKKDDILTILSKLKIKINSYLLKTKNQNNLKLLNDLKEINENKITSLNSTTQATNTTISPIDYKIDANKYYAYSDLEKIFTNILDTSNPYSLEN